MDAEEMTFNKVVVMAAEIEDAAKAAMMSTYGEGAMDTTTPICKVNPVKAAPRGRSP